MKVKADYYRHS